MRVCIRLHALLHALRCTFAYVHCACVFSCACVILQRLYALICALRASLPARLHALVCVFACAFACLALLRFLHAHLHSLSAVYMRVCMWFACSYKRLLIACVSAVFLFSLEFVCAFACMRFCVRFFSYVYYTRLLVHALVCVIAFACMRVCMA